MARVPPAKHWVVSGRPPVYNLRPKRKSEQKVGDEIIDILLVEDNEGDVLLTREALQDAKVKHRLNVVNDGMAAMDFLFHRGPYTQAPRPDLILLDLNLPRMSGREVVAEMKADSSLRSTPLVVLTSSPGENHVLKDYDPRRCLYVVKPSGYEALVEAIGQIHQFWVAATSQPSAS